MYILQKHEQNNIISVQKKVIVSRKCKCWKNTFSSKVSLIPKIITNIGGFEVVLVQYFELK